MASVAEISRLSPGICRYAEPCGGGAGGLTRAELAGMLAGLNRDVVNYALAKYAGDEVAYWDLVFAVRVYAASVAVKEDWEIVRGRPTVYNLSAIAVFEAVNPNRCGTCRGSGFERAKVCRTCSGQTIARYGHAVIADLVGLSETTFRRVWYSRYCSLCKYVLDYDYEIRKRINILNANELVLDGLADSHA